LRPPQDGLVPLRTVHLDDLVSGQVLDLLAAVRCPRTPDGAAHSLTAELWEGAPQPALRAVQHITWQAAGHAANDRQPRFRPVDRLVAAYYANAARREAARLNRAGAYEEARARLLATARRIQAYAGDDPELRALLAALQRDAEQHHAPMSARLLKQSYAASAHAIKGRSSDGERRRSR
jgi:hypothetical protein